jgi:hypothetical protein
LPDARAELLARLEELTGVPERLPLESCVRAGVPALRQRGRRRKETERREAQSNEWLHTCLAVGWFKRLAARHFTGGEQGHGAMGRIEVKMTNPLVR